MNKLARLFNVVPKSKLLLHRNNGPHLSSPRPTPNLYSSRTAVGITVRNEYIHLLSRKTNSICLGGRWSNLISDSFQPRSQIIPPQILFHSNKVCLSEQTGESSSQPSSNSNHKKRLQYFIAIFAVLVIGSHFAAPLYKNTIRGNRTQADLDNQANQLNPNQGRQK